MFGNTRDDGRWDIVQIVRGVSVANEYDLETSRESASNRSANTHLGQQAHDSKTRHLIAREDVCKLSSIETIVATLAKDQLVWLGCHLRMDKPAGRPWLVKRP